MATRFVFLSLYQVAILSEIVCASQEPGGSVSSSDDASSPRPELDRKISFNENAEVIQEKKAANQADKKNEMLKELKETIPEVDEDSD